MKFKYFVMALAVTLVFISEKTAAELSSTNYRITTTVISGGATLWGQPTSK